MNDSQIKISREEKLILLELDPKTTNLQISDFILDTLYYKYLVNKNKDKTSKVIQPKPKKKSGVYIKKPKNNVKLDKNDDKYKVTLEFLNAILKVIGKDPINEITEFKEIRRDDLLKEKCKAVLEDYLEKIIEQFGKDKIHYRKRNIINDYILTIIKSITALCGYNFKSKNSLKYKTTTDKDFKYHLEIFYSIT